MASYWTYLALVCCMVGAGSGGIIAELDSEEAAFISDEVKDIRSVQLLYTYVESMNKTIEDLKGELRKLQGAGAVYVRWGKTTCNEIAGTSLVYTGYAAGSWYSHTGAAANYLCLTTKPTWSNYTNEVEDSGAYLYGAEYEFSYLPDVELAKLHDRDVPCVVCQAPRPSIMMVPGTNVCLDGWTLEYDGHLSAGHYKHNAASEYVCMDGEPNFFSHGAASNTNGALFYFVQTQCGSLVCPPYTNGLEVTCAVCTR